MLSLVAAILFWSLCATVLAGLEVESEGKYGWAEKLPTWYRVTGWPARLFGLLVSGKPLTGYHLYVSILPLFLCHAHFVMGGEWSGAAEFQALALYLVYCVIWDYYWFVLNPHYAGKFSRQYVWWHASRRWVLDLFPVDYLNGIVLSIVVAIGASHLADSPELLTRHILLLAGFAVYTVLLRLLAPAYHAWYRRMRQRDDRDKAVIFHL